MFQNTHVPRSKPSRECSGVSVLALARPRSVLVPEPSCPLPILSNFGKAVDGQLHGQFGRKFSEIAVVILISPLAFGTGHFPCGKSDEGNRVIKVIRVFFRAPWSQVSTKNYCFTAFRVFALDAKFSVYGCKLRVHGHAIHTSQSLDDAIKLIGDQFSRPAEHCSANNQLQNRDHLGRKL
jgi:hypothetical protein